MRHSPIYHNLTAGGIEEPAEAAIPLFTLSVYILF